MSLHMLVEAFVICSARQKPMSTEIDLRMRREVSIRERNIRARRRRATGEEEERAEDRADDFATDPQILFDLCKGSAQDARVITSACSQALICRHPHLPPRLRASLLAPQRRLSVLEGKEKDELGERETRG